jgi:diguanylate cyclase
MDSVARRSLTWKSGFALVALLQLGVIIWWLPNINHPFDRVSTIAALSARLIALGCIVYGVYRYRPAHRLIWWLLGLRFSWSIVFAPIRNLFAPSSLLWQLDAAAGTITYIVVAAVLVGRRAAARDRSLWLDVTVISLGLLFALLSSLEMPAAGTAAQSSHPLLWVFPCIDTVLFALTLLLQFTGTRERNAALELLLAAFTVVVLADLSVLMSYLGLISPASARAFVPVSLSFIGLIGLAAIVPSMRHIGRTLEQVPRSWDLSRLLMIVGAFLLTLYRSMTWTPRNAQASPLLVGLVLAVMFLLIVLRAFLAIRALEASRKRLKHVATHDPATGLLNVAGLAEILAKHAHIEGSSHSLILVRFHELRDVGQMWGHEVADRLVTGSAASIAASAFAEGWLARVAPDRFALLMLSTSRTVQDIERIAETVAGAVRQAPLYLQAGITPVFDIGITRGQRGRSLADLLREAESAATIAHALGRGRIAHYDAAVAAREERRYSLVNSLRGAVERNELQLLYQPIVELETRAIVSYEALLRWSNPELGSISPDEFIPLAESSDAIESITDWVLETACLKIAAIEPRATRGYLMAVNISSRSLRMPGLTQRVMAVLARHNLPPSSLCLEITERSLTEDPHGELGALRAQGVCLAIDDFGTGYSNLATLSQLHADTVKLDMSLVRAVESDEALREVMIGLLRPLRDRGIHLVAEGIETPDQCALMAELGCQLGQGWLFGKPGPNLSP